MNDSPPSLTPPRRGNPALWLTELSAAGLLMYALPTLLNPPTITPAMLVSGNFQGIETSRLWGVVQTGGALLYASALLPLVVLYAVAEMRSRPVATAVIASALGVSTIIQIFSYLPALALQLHPVPAPPPELAEMLRQSSWIRFVALDIAGFSIAYGAGCSLALLHRRRLPWLSRTFLASIAVFLLHLPLLPFAPRLAGGLMEFSVCLCVSLPLMLAALAAPVATPTPSRI